MDLNTFGWTRFFVELSSVLDSSQTQLGVANETYTRYVIERLENGLRCVTSIADTLSVTSESEEQQVGSPEEEVVLRYREITNELSSCIRSLLCYWDLYLDQLVSGSLIENGYQAQAVNRPGIFGRPAFSVEKNQLEYLRSLRFSWTEISDLLGVSRMTVYRRRREFGMLHSPSRQVSTEELTGIVQQLRHENPYCGEAMIMGRLRAMDIVVTRDRLRSVIRIIDPLNTALRWGANTTSRRPYSVPGPNSLWHLGELHCLVDTLVNAEYSWHAENGIIIILLSGSKYPKPL